MKLLCAIWIAVSIFVSQVSSAEAQDANRSAELEVLARQIGRWQTLAVIKPSKSDRKESTSSGEATGEWILGGRFLRMKEHAISDTGRTEYHVLMTYDKRMKSYRRWVFGSDGVIAEATGKWDADTDTMMWTGVGLPDNITITVKTTFTKNGFSEHLFGKYANGNVLIDQSWTFLPNAAESQSKSRTDF